MDVKISSSAFQNGEYIPRQYTCDGSDISPPLEWTNFPKETKSYALINDDPDAPVGTWVHWVMYNIPGETSSLSENTPKEKRLKNGACQGINDFKRIGYGGPCPPSGVHRYFFKIYALNTMLDLEPGRTKAELVEAMKGHVIAQGELMGKYSR